MGLLAEAWERRSTSGLQNPKNWLFDALGGTRTATGKRVDVDSSLQIAAVWSSVRLISESAASLPLVTYERMEPRGKRRAFGHPIYPILHDMVNERQTSFEWVETSVAHLNLRGNTYSWIDRDNGARVKALWILNPVHMKVFALPGGDILYSWEAPGLPPLRALAGSGDILHVRGFNAGDGLIGLSPISMARESLGVALAAEEYGARFFANSTTPSGVLEHPNSLDEPGIERLRASLASFRSLENKHKTLILEEGMKWNTIGISPEDAQMLETRKFQISEIARWFRVPPHMIGDLEKATFSNIEQQGIDFVRHTMRPWLVRIEKALKRDLLLPKERATYFSEFNVDGLLRGDSETRAKAHALGRQWGWLSVNDILEIENRNPIEGGDTYMEPMNMIPAGVAQDPASAPPRPPPSQEDRAASVDNRELRAERSVNLRREIGKALRPVFREAALGVVRAEQRKLSKPIAAIGGEDEAAVPKLKAITERFYESEGELATFARKHLEPKYRALADAIAPIALEEAESDVERDLEPLCDKLARSFAERHAAESRRRLGRLFEEHAQDDDALKASLEEELGNWEEVRPDTIAAVETVKAKSAIARNLFVAAGVLQIRWVTFGESCPICDSLNGKVVGIEQPFASQGSEVGPQGRAIKPRTDIFHGPIHDGCDCDVAIG